MDVRCCDECKHWHWSRRFELTGEGYCFVAHSYKTLDEVCEDYGNRITMRKYARIQKVLAEASRLYDEYLAKHL